METSRSLPPLSYTAEEGENDEKTTQSCMCCIVDAAAFSLSLTKRRAGPGGKRGKRPISVCTLDLAFFLYAVPCSCKVRPGEGEKVSINMYISCAGSPITIILTYTPCHFLHSFIYRKTTRMIMVGMSAEGASNTNATATTQYYVSDKVLNSRGVYKLYLTVSLLPNRPPTTPPPPPPWPLRHLAPVPPTSR